MKHENHQKQLNIEYCEHCEAVHFKTTNVMLNFNKQEFSELANAVMAIYFDVTGWGKMQREETVSDDVLMSELIA
jgi:hypothetical protein